MKFKFKNHLITSAFISGLLLAPEMQASIYTATKLGYVGGTGSSAADISASGQVVGVAYKIGSPFQAVLWQAGSTTATDLGIDSQANGINASGQVVGYAYAQWQRR